jgi:prepilin-type N-terminal cleavage/methylation domain-containing protein
MPKAARPRGGFTLIEMAVGLLVLSLLLATLLAPISAQIDQRKISDTQNALAQINEALIGFAVSKGYLPCPDKTTAAGPGTANDGTEDIATAGPPFDCVVNEGNLPWATLGVPATDAWGNFYRYAVTPVFARRPKALTLSSTGKITVVCPAPACNPAVTYTSVGNLAPAVIMSHGKNGLGAINQNRLGPNSLPTSADELVNTVSPSADGSKTFNIRTTSAGSGGGVGATEFDDIVIWLSTPILLSRMVSAQQLP